MENTNRIDELENFLNLLVGAEITVEVKGVISFTAYYDSFKFLLNPNRLLLSDTLATEINIEVSALEQVLFSEDKEKIQIILDNNEEIILTK